MISPQISKVEPTTLVAKITRKILTAPNNYIKFKHIFENNQGDINPYGIYTEDKITKEELFYILLKIKPILQNKSIQK